METTVRVTPSGISIMYTIVATIISLLILGGCIYLLYLLVKALRIYIKKNS